MDAAGTVPLGGIAIHRVEAHGADVDVAGAVGVLALPREGVDHVDGVMDAVGAVPLGGVAVHQVEAQGADM
eukprot:13758165-Alexandrium_andersonii.AAC.1